MLKALAAELRQTLGILHKRDIQTAAANLGRWVPHTTTQQPILLGDDCAAIPDSDGYLLLAAEGLWPTLVESDPWFAGWCAVLVNVSDVYAMGGRPIAVVDALWSGHKAHAQTLWNGMMAASKAFNVPIVGGHTNCHSPYEALSVAILGRAQRLLTSFNACPGDVLVLITDLDGQPHPQYPFWDAARMKSHDRLQAHLELLPQLAEAELCDTAKDVSMGGIVGTTLMLLEASGCGAIIGLDDIPCPPALSLGKWLINFPSYGFVLSVRPDYLDQIQPLFQAQQLVCQPIGQIVSGSSLILKTATDSVCLWDLQQDPLTGFSGRDY
ncbi:MAG: sll0787 family AIR synthase-like protein [Cyanobacteria bacterium P01_A01_bin.123]